MKLILKITPRGIFSSWSPGCILPLQKSAWRAEIEMGEAESHAKFTISF